MKRIFNPEGFDFPTTTFKLLVLLVSGGREVEHDRVRQDAADAGDDGAGEAVPQQHAAAVTRFVIPTMTNFEQLTRKKRKETFYPLNYFLP